MPNPMPAYPNVRCNGCDIIIPEGENVYFTDNGRLCESCAGETGFVCECGNFKKDDYELCYDCFSSQRDEWDEIRRNSAGDDA
jgi:hypothetical protein